MAVLVYVALDLSLPAMPGAFVFEAADSVDGIAGGRVAARMVVLPSPPANLVLTSAPLRSDQPHRFRSGGEGRPPRHPVARRLPRAACDPSQPSEDPH